MSEVVSGAVFSEDGVYRYHLFRQWGIGTNMTFVMLNPSTADTTYDDPTIKSCCRIARHHGHSRIDVVNLFALRSTDPRFLKKWGDPIGPENSKWIAGIVQHSTVVVCAWGRHGAIQGRGPLVLNALMQHVGQPHLRHLGLNKDGSPKHPLYLPADVELQSFPFHRS